jgi:LDH2 family malate/lactate/ureidoglycolate dehydrogenase
MKPGNVGHFFGALLVEAFRPLDEFKVDMDDLIRRLKGSAKAEGESRIYIHGEKEWEKEEERRKRGIPLHPRVVTMMEQIAEELSLSLIVDNPSKVC